VAEESSRMVYFLYVHPLITYAIIFGGIHHTVLVFLKCKSE
jgi:hypothetical protein